MTIIAAVQDKHRIVVGADSRQWGGEEQSFQDDWNLKNSRKVVQVGDFAYIGVRGWSVVQTALQHHIDKHGANLADFGSRLGVFRFFMEFRRKFLGSYGFESDAKLADEDGDSLPGLHAEFLVASRSGIYVVSSDIEVSEYIRFVAIGSGEKYALGAMSVLFETPKDLEEICDAALDAAIMLDPACGGKKEIFVLEKDQTKGEIDDSLE